MTGEHYQLTKAYGKGRVFYSTLGHMRELWDTPWMQLMYFQALKWTMERPARAPR